MVRGVGEVHVHLQVGVFRDLSREDHVDQDLPCAPLRSRNRDRTCRRRTGRMEASLARKTPVYALLQLEWVKRTTQQQQETRTLVRSPLARVSKVLPGSGATRTAQAAAHKQEAVARPSHLTLFYSHSCVHGAP